MNTVVDIAINESPDSPSKPMSQGVSLKESGEGSARRISETSEKRLRELYADVSYILEIKKVYLDPRQNLERMSRMLNTNTTYLSNVVNQYFGCNLKTLLNRYRINYAKELLRDSDCNIKELPNRCGFLSRSTFYTSFARFEKMSPTDYRNMNHSQLLRISDSFEQ